MRFTAYHIFGIIGIWRFFIEDTEFELGPENSSQMFVYDVLRNQILFQSVKQGLFSAAAL